jgi:hypothetical protein
LHLRSIPCFSLPSLLLLLLFLNLSRR